MIEKKTWEEFKDTGLLWFINTILHIFGWAIVYQPFSDKDNIEYKVYPVRTRFRGFSKQVNDENYLKITEYMVNKSNELLEEIEEENEL